LVGDFAGKLVDVDSLLESRPDVFAHNIEVTRRMTPVIRDVRCSYDRSLQVLAHAKQCAPQGLTKSSIMVGIGETDEEIYETLSDLRAANVDVVTLGQYLRPTPKHAPVDRYVEPERFEEYRRQAEQLGFAFCASGPLVRSSYHAAEAFMAARLGEGRGESSGGGGGVASNAHFSAGAEMAALATAPNPAAPALISADRLVRR
jgi:lipoic acid synthetase